MNFTMKMFLLLGFLYLTGCQSAMESSETEKEDHSLTTNEEINEEEEYSIFEEEVHDLELEGEENRDPYANLLERAPDEPMTIEELLHYPTGPLASKNWPEDKEEIMKKVKELLPPIEEESTENELDAWWKALRYLFSEDYPNPDDYFTQFTISSFGAEDVIDERFTFKDQINVLVILDVSGSMKNEIDGKAMMDIAKDAIREFTSNLPEKVNVGLRVYGHEGQSTGADKSQSCQSTELVFDIQPFDSDDFNPILNQFEPTGWTPIALSLEEAMKDLEAFPGEDNTNLVYIVSDGIETCDGDPVAAAEALADSNIHPIINVIGFNVDIDGQRHLREVAEAGGGLYTNAGNEEQLNIAFEQAEELLRKWEQWLLGNQVDVNNHRAILLNESMGLEAAWGNLNMRETRMLREVYGVLNYEDYITSDAWSYFHSKVNEKNSLYQKFSHEVRDRFVERIEQSYNKTIEELQETYTENISN
ncbi:vWA domain-containing protein [Alkalihalobacterium bogoriense]|uniref:vWA domain-containing protein n=1 Tax=Alkalihalobacterium bogoriense TaxID=246272 RepID=UPI0006854B4C|nr:VWA domain-containing protein [Alkalihalobacterium bogoriense]